MKIMKILFSDNSNKFLQQTNEQVKEEQIYGLSLFQARKLIQHIPDLRRNLRDASYQIELFQKLEEEQVNKINDLMKQVQSLENKQHQHQSVQQLETSTIYIAKISQLKQELQQFETKQYEMESQIQSLEMEKAKLSLELNQIIKQQLNYKNFEQNKASKQNIQQLIEDKQVLLDNEATVQKLMQELSDINNINQYMKLRINNYEKEFEQLIKENVTLQHQLQNQRIQYLSQINNNIKLTQQVKQSDQIKSDLELQLVNSMKQKQEQLENILLEKNKEIQQLKEQILFIEDKRSDPTRSQIIISNQMNQLIQETVSLKQDLLETYRKCEEMNRNNQQLLIQQQLPTNKGEQEQIEQLKNDLKNVKLQLQAKDTLVTKLQNQLSTPQTKTLNIREQLKLQKQLSTLQFNGMNTLKTT